MTPRELFVTTSTVALFGATLIGAAHVAHTRQCRETAGTPRAVVLDCPTTSPAGQRKGNPLPASETAPAVARVAPRATPSAASRTRPLVQPPRPVESGTHLHWAALRECENSGSYRSEPGDYYRGAYQFDRETWASVGGHGDPAAASPAEQDMRARLLYRQRGRQPWPVCGGRL